MQTSHEITTGRKIFYQGSTAKILTGDEFQTRDLPTQIFFDIQPLLPDRIWPFLWLHMVEPIQMVIAMGDTFALIAS